MKTFCTFTTHGANPGPLTSLTPPLAFAPPPLPSPPSQIPNTPSFTSHLVSYFQVKPIGARWWGVSIFAPPDLQ